MRRIRSDLKNLSLIKSSIFKRSSKAPTLMKNYSYQCLLIWPRTSQEDAENKKLTNQRKKMKTFLQKTMLKIKTRLNETL